MTQTTAIDTEGRAPAASGPEQNVRQRMPMARTAYCCDRVQYQAVQAAQAVQYKLYETEEKLEDRGTR